jgi:hypothetical protein
MGNVYKVGDIFVSTTYGVVTILEVDNESIYPRYKCKVYNKIDVRDSIKYYDHHTFNVWRQYEHYKFYPVKE